jgi:hypothetical protein
MDKRPKLRKMDVRFGAWNVRSLYSTDSVMKVTNRILVGKLEGKRPLGRPRRRWVDNIEKYLREIEWRGMD